jgi:hypothetical protein
MREEKKKKNEEKRAGVIVREKSAIKKNKVHKALKIRTSSESGGTPKPEKTLTQDKEGLVEEDQNTTAKGDNDSMPQGDPMPQPKPLIETQNVTNEGNQDKVQEDGNAPNAEVKNKEVHFISIFKLQLLFKSSIVLTDFSLCL